MKKVLGIAGLVLALWSCNDAGWYRERDIDIDTTKNDTIVVKDTVRVM